MRSTVWAATAALALGLGPVPAAAASSPTPGVTTPADISSVLADPPALDYLPVPDGVVAGSHIGPLDVDDLVAEGDGTAALRALYEAEGFTRGYRRAWVQRSTSIVLIERVEEFRFNAGAEDNLTRSRSHARQSADFRGFFGTSGLGDAYGARVVASSSLETDIAGFVKGNLLLMVSASQPGRPSTGLALSQARSEYASAPAETIDQRGQPGTTLAIVRVAALGALALLALAVLAAAVVVLVVVARRRTPPRPLPVFADPRYRWDGSTWREVSPPERRP